MPSLSAEELKRAFKQDPLGISKVLGSALRDFGYSVTDDWVREEITRQDKGEKPQGGPGMFLAGWLKDGIEDD